MRADTQKTLRTAAGVAAWVAMLALSQESAALDNPQREDFARYQRLARASDSHCTLR